MQQKGSFLKLIPTDICLQWSISPLKARSVVVVFQLYPLLPRCLSSLILQDLDPLVDRATTACPHYNHPPSLDIPPLGSIMMQPKRYGQQKPQTSATLPLAHQLSVLCLRPIHLKSTLRNLKPLHYQQMFQHYRFETMKSEIKSYITDREELSSLKYELS